MKKSIIVNGWAAKANLSSKIIWDTGEPKVLSIYRYKGKKEEWGPEDWPPIKVRVIIEEIDTENKLIRIDKNEN